MKKYNENYKTERWEALKKSAVSAFSSQKLYGFSLQLSKTLWFQPSALKNSMVSVFSFQKLCGFSLQLSKTL